MNIHQQTMPYVPASVKNAGEAERQQLMQQERALMYVVASRAVYTLTLTGVAVQSEWLL